METVYFLIVIGVYALVVVWAARRSKAKSRRAGKSKEQLLTTPADSRLSHKEQVWEARLNEAEHDVAPLNPFAPKFESTDGPKYDGWSRRNRHHLATKAQVGEDSHVEDIEKSPVTGVDSGERPHASPS